MYTDCAIVCQMGNGDDQDVGTHSTLGVDNCDYNILFI